LSFAVSRSPALVWIAAGVSAIAFVSMYGVMMQIAVRGDWPNYFGLGNPSTNLMSRAVHSLYTSDLIITAGAITLLVIATSLLSALLAPAGDLTPPKPRLATLGPSTGMGEDARPVSGSVPSRRP
jgi:hypothetical protein